ncbi:RraA family protein [Anianabacter salinae]|uniref:RraA family protein n=1 Tax=Anianabacter salinae TaxID=2851023 RepID=UPI00225E2E87|nr:RraA family protein [Anianabacter salinae]MBV0914010.1 RraA family protein [Anianabacter salinae]
MDDELFNLLRRCDTPTVCNAIEVAQGKRGFDAYTRGTVLRNDPAAPAVVGYAVTARIAALAPPTEPVADTRARRMAYYRHMSEARTPSIAVVEDTDSPHCVGAFWGEINTWVHKSLGVSGVLTNGVMRDLGDCAPGFPVVAGSIGPSHAFVHVTEIGGPVTVFGLTVAEGDLVHADRHGAVVIPPDVLPELAGAIHKLIASEEIVLGEAKKGPMTFEAFERCWEAFERART